MSGDHDRDTAHDYGRRRKRGAFFVTQMTEEEKRVAQQRRENCARAQDSVRVLETGRVSRTDASGERYFLDDNQLAQESAKARQDVRDWCN